jgi:hypothetical protein
VNRAQAIAAHQPTGDIDSKIIRAKSEIVGLMASNNFSAGDSTLASLVPEALPPGVHVQVGWARVDDRVNEALKNPQLLLYKLQSSAYKFAWALIPLSLPFMWLMFAWRRQYKVYDHAIFVTYSLSATMLLLALMAVVGATGLSSAWMLLLIPVHFFLQLKGAYQLSIGSALLRTIALLITAQIVLTLFSAILLLLGLLG